MKKQFRCYSESDSVVVVFYKEKYVGKIKKGNAYMVDGGCVTMYAAVQTDGTILGFFEGDGDALDCLAGI